MLAAPVVAAAARLVQLAALRTAGFTSAYLTSQTTSARAIALYRRLGFAPCGFAPCGAAGEYAHDGACTSLAFHPSALFIARLEYAQARGLWGGGRR